MPHIPFQTLGQRHTVYAYAAVLFIHAAYALNLWLKTHKAKSNPPA